MPPTSIARRDCPRIAVIGGGISGLAAAHRITELLPQAELALFESAGRLGGILDTARRGDFLVERSADSFQTKLPCAVDLCRRLGIADRLLPTDDARRRALVVRAGELLPIPSGFYLMSPSQLGPVLKAPLLSWTGKARMLMEPFVVRGPASATLAPQSNSSSAAADESVADFATRRLGREVFERLVQPLVAGIYTGDAARLSMAATLPEFLAMERDHGSLLRATLFRPTGRPTDSNRTGHLSGQPPANDSTHSASGARYGLFAAPPEGMAALVAAIAARLPASAVHLNTSVSRAIRNADAHWQLELQSTGLADGTRNPSPVFDAVILAVPTYAAAKMLAAAPELAAELEAIEYASCAVVSVACRRGQIGHPLDSFGFVVPQIENRPIIAASFASQKFAGRAPADGVLIRVFVGGALRPQLVELPDAELEVLVRRELGALLDLRGEPLWIDIARWRRCMPQYYVGHLDRVARIESLAARRRGLALAGNAYHGVGIPQCIRSGEQAAQQIVDDLRC